MRKIMVYFKNGETKLFKKVQAYGYGYGPSHERVLRIITKDIYVTIITDRIYNLLVSGYTNYFNIGEGVDD